MFLLRSSCCFVVFCSLAAVGMAAKPLPRAHAHNDYEHKKPLLDALSHGFCSVEADVFAIDGELRVAHDRKDTQPGHTLEKLYLDPLREIVRRNQGRVFPAGPSFYLLIDFKTDGEPTYEVLRKVLAEYPDLFAAKSKEARPPVAIVVSGNRPFEAIQKDTRAVVGVDGRLSDLDSKMSSKWMPLISDNWNNHFRWRGDGEMPEDEREKLADAVQRAHRAGRRVRFWATPEKEAVWQALYDAGVDHINTDQLEKLQQFLLRQTSGE